MTSRSVSFIIPVRNDAERLRALPASIPPATPRPPTSRSSSPTTDRRTVRRGGARRRARRCSSCPASGSASCATGRPPPRAARSWRSSTPTTRSSPEWVPAAIDALGRSAASPRSGRPIGRRRPAPGSSGSTIGCAATRRARSVDWLGSGNMAVRRAAFDGRRLRHDARNLRGRRPLPQAARPGYVLVATSASTTCTTATRRRCGSVLRRALARPRQRARQPAPAAVAADARRAPRFPSSNLRGARRGRRRRASGIDRSASRCRRLAVRGLRR